MHAAKSVLQVLFVLRFDSNQMSTQRFRQIYRQHRNAIPPALGITHRDLRELEVDIFTP